MGLFLEYFSLAREYWLYVLAFGLIARLLRNRYKPGLRHIPGPFLASLTDVWSFVYCVLRKSNKDYLLHRKYNSPLLRLGPNTVSVADPEAIRIIYGYKPVFQKASHNRLYISQHQTSKTGEVIRNLSSERDEQRHAQLRRPVAHAYAMSTLVEFEPLVDSTTRHFMRVVNERFVKTGAMCPLAEWLQLYAFDIIGELTFSTRLGFLDAGHDVDHMMYYTAQAMDYIGMIGQLPTIDEYLRVKNVVLRWFRPTGHLVRWTVDRIREHVSDSNPSHPDFLTRFLQARDKYPEIMTESQLEEYANTNVSAGSDTTAITLRSLIYELLTHPDAYHRFMKEISSTLKARLQDEHFDDPIKWTEGLKMPFFQACIKECLRYHPALGQILPRDVGEGGVELCGKFLPEGTVVGCNAWTVHRDKELYGEDADEWRPDRWLDADEARVRRMENLNFAFGGGSRLCIGKNIAMLEMTKFITEFFRRYEVELVDPKRWKLQPGWLVVQSGLDVYLKLRDPKSLLVER